MPGPAGSPCSSSKSAVWDAMAGCERLVLVPRVVGDLASEPLGRLERLRGPLVGELDLDDVQALEVTTVAVQLERQVAGARDQVAALAHAAGLGQRPEALEAIAGDRELLLLPRPAGPLL